MPTIPPPASGRTTGKRRVFRALVVDDHDDSRTLYAEYLRGRGWQVEEAADGAAAMAVAAVFEPDVIVMDVAMPEMDGVTATRYLKRDRRTASVPIIVLTAHPWFEAAAARAGCSAFVTKPRSPKELLDVVRRVLEPDNVKPPVGA
jgi:CheY-like chemotaxis protein